MNEVVRHAFVVSLLLATSARQPEGDLPGAQTDLSELAGQGSEGGLTLRWESPADGQVVHAELELTLRGSSLVNVELFHDGRRLARAAVSPDGRSASATIDTVRNLPATSRRTRRTRAIQSASAPGCAV
jgi:hypothetical protein